MIDSLVLTAVVLFFLSLLFVFLRLLLERIIFDLLSKLGFAHLGPLLIGHKTLIELSFNQWLHLVHVHTNDNKVLSPISDVISGSLLLKRASIDSGKPRTSNSEVCTDGRLLPLKEELWLVREPHEALGSHHILERGCLLVLDSFISLLLVLLLGRGQFGLILRILFLFSLLFAMLVFLLLLLTFLGIVSMRHDVGYVQHKGSVEHLVQSIRVERLVSLIDETGDDVLRATLFLFHLSVQAFLLHLHLFEVKQVRVDHF